MSNSSWFRLYAEFATDPKIQMMPEAFQRRYIMLLCICCNEYETLHVTLPVTGENVTCVTSAFHDSSVAFQLRISEDDWRETKAVFLAKNLIDENNIPTAWSKRQYLSNSSAARVRKHREKARKQVVTGDVSSHQMKRYSNVTVTPPDTDTDTDVNPKNIKPLGQIADAIVTGVPKIELLSDPDPPKPAKPAPAGFGEFWFAYPRKVGKGAAESAWAKLKPPLPTVLTAIERARSTEQWRKDGGQFIPHPATWLNQRRWEDEQGGYTAQKPDWMEAAL